MPPTDGRALDMEAVQWAHGTMETSLVRRFDKIMMIYNKKEEEENKNRLQLCVPRGSHCGDWGSVVQLRGLRYGSRPRADMPSFRAR